MTHAPSLKKPLLYVLIASVILGAVFGVTLILMNTWGWFEVRVMLTTVIIAVASLCGLACDLSKLPRGLNLLPRSGLVLTGIAALLLLFGIWLEFSSEEYWKATIVASIFGVATVHACLLSIARLSNRFRWVAFIGKQLIYGLAIMLALIIVGEVDSRGLWRFVAALSIVVAAVTLVIPILHRISRLDEKQSTELLMPNDARNLHAIDSEIASLKDRIAELEQLRATISEAGMPS